MVTQARANNVGRNHEKAPHKSLMEKRRLAEQALNSFRCPNPTTHDLGSLGNHLEMFENTPPARAEQVRQAKSHLLDRAALVPFFSGVPVEPAVKSLLEAMGYSAAIKKEMVRALERHLVNAVEPDRGYALT